MKRNGHGMNMSDHEALDFFFSGLSVLDFLFLLAAGADGRKGGGEGGEGGGGKGRGSGVGGSVWASLLAEVSERGALIQDGQGRG